MDESLILGVEINETMLERLEFALQDLSEDEIDWRPLPEANSINIIVRHLRIEAEWHLRGLELGEPIPTLASEPPQEQIDAIPINFEANYFKLKEFYRRFIDVLKKSSLQTIEKRTASAYGRTDIPMHRIAYHQALHIGTHCGQIRMIRNLYSKTHGRPARFFPVNPSYPR
jgi:uncharacterized protein DUF664